MLTIYQSFLNHVSSLSGVGIDFIENILGTLFIILCFFTLNRLLKKIATNRLSEEYRDEVVAEIIPSVLKFTAFGFMAKIWLTGEASFESTFQVSKDLMKQFVETIYVILFYLAAKFATEVFAGIKFAHNEAKQYTMRRTSVVVISIICCLLFLKIWLSKSTDLSTYFGLLSAGLAIALQDIIASIAGWIYILMVKPFKVGDRVQIGESKGDVTDVKLLQFSLLETGHWVGAEQPTGRILFFPNSFVFKNSIANYHGGFEYIFAEMPVMVTFESDWQRASAVLSAILEKEANSEKEKALKQIRKASRDMRLMFSHLNPKVITSVSDSGVVLTLRFMCKIRERRFMESRIWEKILLEFAKEPAIDLAYPTTRYFYHPKEGKDPAALNPPQPF